MHSFVLGVDLAETEIRLGMVDEDTLLRGFVTLPITQLFEAGRSPVANLEEAIRHYIQNSSVVPSAVSIGFPSTLDRSRHRLQSSPNLPGFSNVDIISMLERDLHISVVYIDRDAVMLYYHDCYFFQLPGDSILIGCYVGSGLGNVISIHGHVLYGTNGSAAELGHVPVYGLTHPCRCGNKGCIEQLVSWARLEEIARRHYGGAPFPNLFQEHADDPELQAFIEAIAVAVAIEVNLLDPEFVIMGGSVVQLPSFPRATFESHVRAHARKPYPAKNLKILYSSASPENGVKGAGLYGFKRMKSEGRR